MNWSSATSGPLPKRDVITQNGSIHVKAPLYLTNTIGKRDAARDRIVSENLSHMTKVQNNFCLSALPVSPSSGIVTFTFITVSRNLSYFLIFLYPLKMIENSLGANTSWLNRMINDDTPLPPQTPHSPSPLHLNSKSFS